MARMRVAAKVAGARNCRAVAFQFVTAEPSSLFATGGEAAAGASWPEPCTLALVAPPTRARTAVLICTIRRTVVRDGPWSRPFSARFVMLSSFHAREWCPRVLMEMQHAPDDRGAHLKSPCFLKLHRVSLFTTRLGRV